MKKLILSAIALVAMASASAQDNPMLQPIPADKDVRVGRLENGMTYYIRHNEKPKSQAHFYILHDVGAIQEEDNQQGLAHFLEHMAFNGTKNLPDKMLIEYLEKIGVKFGANLNAGTAWDYTQYTLMDVPTTREGIIDTALLILHDWSHFIALEPEEIDSERGVIMEELRTRDGAGWRSTINMVKALAKGTKYENRNLIGYLDGLKGFEHGDLESFYHTWYRPDYQAIFVVGDVDVDAVESKIKTLMSDIPAPAADAPKKEVIYVPDNEEPIVSIFTDPEMQYSSISMYCKRKELAPKEIANTVYAEMINVALSYMDNMGNARFNEMTMKPDAPFLGAGMGNGSVGICPTLEVTVFSAQAEEGKIATTMEALCTEMERIQRYGFTQSEFERAQNELLRSAERKYANRNDRKNGEFMSNYVNSYRFNTAIPDAETEWQLDSMLIKNLTVDVVNDLAKQIITDNNMVVVINAPEKEGLVNPTAEEVTAIIKKAQASEVEPYEDNTVKEPLIGEDVVLKGSKVKKTTVNETLGTTEWTLKNGTRVIVKPSKLKADEVLFRGYAEGGLSTLSDEDYYTGNFLTSTLSMSGVSKFSVTDLRKQLSGKTASVYMDVNDYDLGVKGSCSPKDIETMLQLVYLNFTSPRFNQDDFNTMMKQYEAYVENLKTNPDYIAAETLQKTLYNNNPRRQMLSPEILAQVNFDRMPEVFKQLYPNGNAFTYTIIGNVDLETLKPLVEKYIGSLPVSKNKLGYKDDGVRTVKGEVTNDFKTPMQQPKVTVTRVFTGEIPYTIENKVAMTLLSQALDSRYLVSIREEKGGTYGVQVGGGLGNTPFEKYSLTITFDTNAEMADELSDIVMAEFKKIAEEGPLTEDIEKTREFLVKNWSNTLESNGGVLGVINYWYQDGLDYMNNYLNTVKSVTNEDVQKLAQKILADGNMVYVVMRPEAEAQAEQKAEAPAAE